MYPFIRLLLPLILLAALPVSGQTGSLSGRLTDKKDNSPLIGATVILLNADSSLYKGSAADLDGKFLITDVLNGQYILKASYVGYKDHFRTISFNQTIDLGDILLTSSATELKGVTITQKAPTAVQKGDTTQYNAESYKTNPDANAEQLITKMSGVTVQDGKVQAHGEEVKRVLVDGKPFFGDDPNAVLKNLPAEVIDKIQVFDEQSEQAKFTGVSDGNTSKTINIITKPGMKNGIFGRTYAGYGYEDVYRAGANINFFEGDRRFTILAQSNNVNEQNFASEDLAGVMSSSGGGGRGGQGRGGPGGGGGNWGASNNSSNFLVNARNGISTTNAAGINYSDKWGKKTEFSGSYFFNDAYNVADQSISRQYFQAADSGQVYNETSLVRSRNQNHRGTFKLEWKPDSLNKLTIQPRFSYQGNSGSTSTEGSTYFSDSPLNSTRNIYSSELSSYSLNNEIQYQRKFQKKGRTISATFNTSWNGTDAGSELQGSNSFFTDSSFVANIIDQESDLTKTGSTYSGNITYTEPVFKDGVLQIQYNPSISYSENDKRTYNFDGSTMDHTALDTSLSNVFRSTCTTQKAGLAYRYNNEKINWNIGANYQVATLSNERSYPLTYSLDKSFNNILPYMMLRYSFTDKRNIRLAYRTSTTQPSADQLQDVLNNSNPLQLSKGNSRLDQSYEQMVFARFSSSNTEKATSFFAMLSGTYTSDYISRSTFTAPGDTVYEGVFLARGTQLSMPVNVEGHFIIRSFITYGLPLTVIRTNLNINLNGSFNNVPGFLNGELNTAQTQNYGGGLTFSSNISKDVDFTITTNTSYSITNNSLSERLNTSFLNQTSSARINVIIAKHLVVSTEATHQYYSGLSAGFNQSFVIWNGALAYKFLKDNRAEIRASVNDILGQNKSISRNVTETYIEDIQTTVLQRYFMLTFTYNIKSFPGKGVK
jgi:hypothetical protein